MRRRTLRLPPLRLALLPLFLAAPADAQQAPAKPDSAPAAGALPPAENASVTRHYVRIGGQPVRYTATAGYMPIRTEAGEHKASIFYIAYTKDGEQPAGRPITFAYNGGPGSSSVWLHMGAFGPRRVVMGPEGEAPAPPYRVVGNEFSILDVTDLVFIDPVTTGYSRAADEKTAKEFHGVREDAESVAEFIRLYTTRNARWASPKFLAGESYGTTRSAALSGVLQQRHGMYLNGVVLVSSVLEFQTLDFTVGNDLPYILFLPTYTATAWYHRRLPPDLQARELTAVLDEVETFALGDYASALLRGRNVPAEQRRRIAERVARYTGLTPEYVEQTNLRVEDNHFTKELLRGQRRTVGRLDSRYLGIDREAVGERYEFDPSYAAIQGPYTAAVMNYLRSELDFRSDLPYEILTGRVRPWKYPEGEYLNVAETLRQAMTANSSLKVFVANGYYDMATPYFATEYTFDHLALDPSLENNVRMGYYDAGHMMYVHLKELEALKRDVADFIRWAAAPAR